jgi:hypothetical protein
MQRTIASLALASLSLVLSYAIVAVWPDRVAVAATGIVKAQAASIASTPAIFVPSH